ncbi:hypothetical protein GCM10010911_53600 [Paenibacillus nasutitermitis]|uniref:Uncharacterized protein n=1 Tax=Paenibacillus nasutitermitis TaxID=1652958 RepID=A0A916ZD50_9BACL|nr:hypothetical protein GCM10010911_53600 [Paenibacillus nasutitermitis]
MKRKENFKIALELSMPKKQITKIIGCKNVDSKRYEATLTDAAAQRSLPVQKGIQ